MTDNKTIGQRIRELRSTMTQQEFADTLGISRSYLGVLESGGQEPSRNFFKTLRAKLGVNADWLLYGEGEKYIRKSGGDASQRNGTEAQSAVVREAPSAYGTEAEQAEARHLVKRFAAARPEKIGRFGYMLLKGNGRIRLHAARDKGISNSPNLLHIVEEDNLWVALGDVKGWEFEVLREYLEEWGDRDLEYWFEVLRFVRWGAERAAAAERDVDLAAESQR